MLQYTTLLKRNLMWVMMEKESAIMVAKKKAVENEQTMHKLVYLLKKAWKERDEAVEELQRLLSVNNHILLTSAVDYYYNMQIDNLLVKAAEKPLPEKGKLKQAVQASGPLLKTLLDEFTPPPLPHRRNPPPISSYLESKKAVFALLKSVKMDHENINNIIPHYYHDGVVLPVVPSSSSTVYHDDFARGSASSSCCFNDGGMSNPDLINYQI